MQVRLKAKNINPGYRSNIVDKLIIENQCNNLGEILVSNRENLLNRCEESVN